VKLNQNKRVSGKKGEGQPPPLDAEPQSSTTKQAANVDFVHQKEPKRPKTNVCPSFCSLIFAVSEKTDELEIS
jgi:hypothetical protein